MHIAQQAKRNARHTHNEEEKPKCRNHKVSSAVGDGAACRCCIHGGYCTIVIGHTRFIYYFNIEEKKNVDRSAPKEPIYTVHSCCTRTKNQ